MTTRGDIWDLPKWTCLTFVSAEKQVTSFNTLVGSTASTYFSGPMELCSWLPTELEVFPVHIPPHPPLMLYSLLASSAGIRISRNRIFHCWIGFPLNPLTFGIWNITTNVYPPRLMWLWYPQLPRPRDIVSPSKSARAFTYTRILLRSNGLWVRDNLRWHLHFHCPGNCWGVNRGPSVSVCSLLWRVGRSIIIALNTNNCVKFLLRQLTDFILQSAILKIQSTFFLCRAAQRVWHLIIIQGGNWHTTINQKWGPLNDGFDCVGEWRTRPICHLDSNYVYIFHYKYILRCNDVTMHIPSQIHNALLSTSHCTCISMKTLQ